RLDRVLMLTQRRERAGQVISSGDAGLAVRIRIRRGLELRDRRVQLRFFGREGARRAQRRGRGNIAAFGLCTSGYDARVKGDHRIGQELLTTRLALLAEQL